MATSELLDNLKELLGEVTNYNVKALTTNDDWGTINFNNAEKSLDTIISLLVPAKDFDFSEVPDSNVNQMISATTAVNDIKNEIAQFDLSQGNPSDTRDQLTIQLNAAVNNLFPAYAPWLPFLAYRRGDIKDSLVNLQKAIDEAQQELRTAKEYTKNKKTEVDTIVDAAKTAAAEVGVQSFTQDFDGQATDAKDAAKKWLMASGIFAALTLLASILFISLFAPEEGSSTSTIIQISLSKIVSIGILFTATLWCGKIYKALKHQQAVNSHKAHALKTFQAFVEASNDPTIRDAVLMETTRSIFSIGASGYLEAGQNSTVSSPTVIEVIKGVSETSSQK
ncbi:MAG: hypothetical protein L3J58_12540 [Emcibacter sp.]|nr:hypothetical protein [Emcibacter sp.]